MKTNPLVLVWLFSVGNLSFAAPTPDGPYIYTVGTATISARADQV
jgi:hypothetical protein